MAEARAIRAASALALLKKFLAKVIMASLNLSVESGRPRAAVPSGSGLVTAFAVVAFAAFAFGAATACTFATTARAFLCGLHVCRGCLVCTGIAVHLEVP
jgi:hypothetical protein